VALTDDLNKLAAQDVVYVTRKVGNGPTEVFRGRLRQALNGDWVFNASTGQNGVMGFILGGVSPSWNSSESPTTGLQITVSFPTNPGIVAGFNEVIVLTSVIPTDFAD
jgi:hypothetical protein